MTYFDIKMLKLSNKEVTFTLVQAWFFHSESQARGVFSSRMLLCLSSRHPETVEIFLFVCLGSRQ